MTDPQHTHESNEIMQEEASETAVPVQTEEAPPMTSDGDVPEEGTPPPQGPRDFFGLQSFLNVLVVVIFVITFVVQAFRVPSESMENTLLVGDFILADKLHFGQDGVIWHTILPYRPIHRGDVVVFLYPVDPSQDVGGRVIGLPGDRIHLNGGTVYLNGKRQEESYVIHSFPYPNFYRDNFPTEGYMSPETDRKWRIQMLQYVQDGDLVVPPDSYFVMGDNRDRSLDSRYW